VVSGTIRVSGGVVEVLTTGKCKSDAPTDIGVQGVRHIPNNVDGAG